MHCGTLKCVLIATLIFLGHVTPSVTWLFACPLAISHRCSIGSDTLSPGDFEILRLKCIWVTLLTVLGHVTLSVTWPFACPSAISYTCSIGRPTDVLSPRDFEILHLKNIWVTVLSFLGHVTSSVTWPFDSPHLTSYRCSIGADTLSPRDFEILSLKCIWVRVLTFLGHVPSLVTWSFFQRYVVSYRWSVDTSFLTGKVTKIFGCKGPINAMSSQACIFPV